MRIAFIGGYSLISLVDNPEEEVICKCECGNVIVLKGEIKNKKVYVVPRHGKKHEFPPHKVPVKEIFLFLHKEGIKDVITVHSVGIINESWKIPCIAIIDDFIDFTGKIETIYECFKEKPVHVEMHTPYHAPYQELLEKIFSKYLAVYRGIYAQTLGPRLETKAEIRALKILGADMVGMTHARECTLANELGMRIASIGMGVNYACGINQANPSAEEIIAKSHELSQKVAEGLKEFILSLNV